MKKTIKMNLTDYSIKKTIGYLEQYKKDLVGRRMQMYISRLADVGIVKAKENAIHLNDLGNISNCVTFYKQLNPTTTGCKAIVYGADAVRLISTWKTKSGIKSAEVSAILMAEFGSGNNAISSADHINLVHPTKPVGQGTFPNQTHAFDKYWSWLGTDGQWHSSKGITPTMPMYKAWLEMYNQIGTIAREVF